MIKNLVVHGFRLWKRQRHTITLVASQASYTIGQKAAGTATSTTESKLNDTLADFINDVAVDDVVKNTADGTSTTITAIDSRYILSLAADIFVSGETYTITTADESFPRPERILECDRVDSNGNEVDITALSLREYENLPNKTQTGTPINYFYDPTLNNGRLYLWMAPDASAVTNFTVNIVALTQVNDMDASTDLFDFPQEWYEPIRINLAYKLSGPYGGLNLGQKQMLRQDAKDLLDGVINYDQDMTSVFFSPEMRQQ